MAERMRCIYSVFREDNQCKLLKFVCALLICAVTFDHGVNWCV